MSDYYEEDDASLDYEEEEEEEEQSDRSESRISTIEKYGISLLQCGDVSY